MTSIQEQQNRASTALEHIKRIEIYIWNGQVCQAWRELGKLRPVMQSFPEYFNLVERISFRLREGHQIDAHSDVKRLFDRLSTTLSKLSTTETETQPTTRVGPNG